MARFLLNKTRGEAVYILEDKEDIWPMINLTKKVRHLLKEWSYTDEILFYQEDGNIYESRFDGYTQMNFMIVNREVVPL